MTYQDDFTLPTELLEQVAEQGLDFLPELIRIVINTAMQVERQKYLGVGPYERSAERQGHANGFKPKTVSTRIAPITFDIPQVREGGFYPQALEKGLRSERALMLALAEMYVQGVSTRKVAAITERLCGSEISSTQVSRASALLDKVLEAWRNRALGTVIYLYLDARYEKVRLDGQIRDDGQWSEPGRQTPDPGRVRFTRRAGAALARLPAKPGRTRPERGGADHQRCPRGVAGGSQGSLQRYSLAALPVPLAAERQPVCAAPEHEAGSGSRYPRHLQCPRSSSG